MFLVFHDYPFFPTQPSPIKSSPSSKEFSVFGSPAFLTSLSLLVILGQSLAFPFREVNSLCVWLPARSLGAFVSPFLPPDSQCLWVLPLVLQCYHLSLWAGGIQIQPLHQVSELTLIPVLLPRNCPWEIGLPSNQTQPTAAGLCFTK